jgi:hypothetical protein
MQVSESGKKLRPRSLLRRLDPVEENASQEDCEEESARAGFDDRGGTHPEIVRWKRKRLNQQ